MTFAPPFDSALVSRQTDVTVHLPDPPRTPQDPLVRPGVARHAGSPLVLMHLQPVGAPVHVGSPVAGSARTVANVGPGSQPIANPSLNGGVYELAEISPFPFVIAKILRALGRGVPTFYLGCAGPYVYPPTDDQALRTGQTLASEANHVYFGAHFADGAALAPWSWIELIRAALEQAGEAAAAVAWAPLAALYPPPAGRVVRLLDAAGRPNSIPASSQYRTSPTSEWQIVAPFGSELQLPAEATELRWGGGPPAGETPLPVHSFYEGGTSSPPGQSIALPPAKRAHLQVLDLASWFAPPPPSSAMARFHASSRVEWLVDGIPTFKRLVDDLLAAGGPGGGTHLAGYGFSDFPLDKGRKDAAGADVDTRLTALIKRIRDQGGDARLLVFKLVNPKSGAATQAQTIATSALLLSTTALILLSAFRDDTKPVGFGVVLGGYLVAQTLVSAGVLGLTTLDALEPSKDIFPKLDAIQPGLALWARHPIRLDDNPVKQVPLPLNLEQLVDQFGFLHQKIQLVKRATPDEGGNRFVAYLGGIDLHSDRLDTPGHHGKAYQEPDKAPGPPKALPFHDVHARITGPVAADVFKAWDERYQYHAAESQARGEITAPLPTVFPPPSAADAAALPPQPAGHIAQVARTYFKPAQGSTTTPFPFAPSGERTVADSLLRCVREARQYIYIEDPYFTPYDWPDRPAGTLADTFFDALLDAADYCRRLLVVVPSETDQPFGDVRRRTLYSKLTARWGDRMLFGAVLRRPVLPNPGQTACEGRCVLLENIGPNHATFTIGPKARIQSAKYPFWLWIDGELMLVKAGPRDSGSDPTGQAVDVIRAHPGMGVSVRGHRKGAPVTLSQLVGIYMNSKTMIVDDVLVTAGSSNVTRRGLAHDAEIRLFVVPGALRAAADNPARALRTALWAEHLGLPPALGPVLLADPIAAFDLFRRSWFEGNRFVRQAALDLKPHLGFSPGGNVLGLALTAGAVLDPVVGFTDEIVKLIWNDLSDPTSGLDPHPAPGPA